MSCTESPELGSLLGQQEAQDELYPDHEIKEEMVIGPTEVQRPKQTPGHPFWLTEPKEEVCQPFFEHEVIVETIKSEDELLLNAENGTKDMVIKSTEVQRPKPGHPFRLTEPKEEVCQPFFEHEVIVETIKSEDELLLNADNGTKDMVIKSTEVQRPAPGHPFRLTEPKEEVCQPFFEHEVIVETIKSEDELLLNADNGTKDMVIKSTEVQRPAPGHPFRLTEPKEEVCQPFFEHEVIVETIKSEDELLLNADNGTKDMVIKSTEVQRPAPVVKNEMDLLLTLEVVKAEEPEDLQVEAREDLNLSDVDDKMACIENRTQQAKTNEDSEEVIALEEPNVADDSVVKNEMDLLLTLEVVKAEEPEDLQEEAREDLNLYDEDDGHPFRLTEPKEEEVCQRFFEHEVIVETIKSEDELLLNADNGTKDIKSTEVQRPAPGVCARGGECSAELRARATPHDNGLPPTQPQLEPSQRQSSSDASLQPCHSTPHQRKQHQQPQNQHKAFECHYCGKIFIKKRHLISHIGIHNINNTFKCNICDKKFAKKTVLVRHGKIHSGKKPFTCDICNKKFTHSGDLKRHKRVHTGERPFVCNVCSKKFAHSSSLIIHNRVHNGEKPFVCDVCDKKFTQSGGLKKHKYVHSGEKPFVCNVCDKKFTQSGHLKGHKDIHSGDKPFACDVCDKKFTQAGLLIRHKKIHSGETFACDVCHLKFTRPENLKRHQKMHTGQKSFSCDFCAKKYFHSADLKLHIKIHSGERPFACDLCEKKFVRPGHLINHKVIHTGIKRFACDVCKKKFLRPGDVKIHEKIHSGDRPFACDACDKKFTQAGALKRHKKVHSREQPSDNGQQ